MTKDDRTEVQRLLAAGKRVAKRRKEQEKAAPAPAMYADRDNPSNQEVEEARRSAQRVKIKQGLDEARSVFNRGGDLPAYLEKALIRYEAAFWAGVNKRLIMPKLVKRAHDKGMPLSKKSRKTGAFEHVAAMLDVSESKANRAHDDYPASPDDTAMPVNRAPVSIPKKMGKSSKR